MRNARVTMDCILPSETDGMATYAKVVYKKGGDVHQGISIAQVGVGHSHSR
jgi:hypothetical protein